ncbi:integrase core domain-containing protein [Streptomyces sp. NPDC002730]|uniref:integrase core domain-containing protein n=1 Tax=Streptomyces sp. NPDC002730 TaxID=3364662 RepID=UPI0036A7D60B
MHHGAVELLMRRAGLPGNRTRRPRPETPSVADLVNRDFTRHARDQQWVTEHHRTPHLRGQGVLRRRPGRLLAPGGRLVDDTSPTAAPATNALSMAIGNRHPQPGGTIIHCDHGVQFGSRAFTERARASGLLPSMGSVGDCVDNALTESFWARVQVERLDRRRWRTRLELSTALSEYLEIFHNRQRRHSALEMLTPSSTSCAQHL